MEECEPGSVEEPRAIRVGIIGHVSSSGRTSLLAALAQSKILLIDDPAEIAELLANTRLGEMELYPGEALDLSPYGGTMFKRSKGEKKRERAWNRRLWGKGNSF